MSARRFEIIDHTADVGLAAYGATCEELFANAALGMFSVIGDAARVRPAETRRVHVRADGLESLLAVFLSELLYQLEVDRFVPHDVEVESISDAEVRAVVHGEPLAPRHELHTEIKAVTHHGLTVEKTDEGWRATVLFDV